MTARIVDFSRDPKWREIFFGEPTVKQLEEFRSYIVGEARDVYSETLCRLYHATSADYPIEREGLLPTSTKRRHSLQSQSGYVYLAAYPTHAKQFAEMWCAGKPIALYAVDLPFRMLSADSDQLRNKRMWGGIPCGTTLWESFFIGSGARHKGAIQPHAIKRCSLEAPHSLLLPRDEMLEAEELLSVGMAPA
jgi:hypothetical protein